MVISEKLNRMTEKCIATRRKCTTTTPNFGKQVETNKLFYMRIFRRQLWWRPFNVNVHCMRRAQAGTLRILLCPTGELRILFCPTHSMSRNIKISNTHRTAKLFCLVVFQCAQCTDYDMDTIRHSKTQCKTQRNPPVFGAWPSDNVPDNMRCNLELRSCADTTKWDYFWEHIWFNNYFVPGWHAQKKTVALWADEWYCMQHISAYTGYVLNGHSKIQQRMAKEKSCRVGWPYQGMHTRVWTQQQYCKSKQLVFGWSKVDCTSRLCLLVSCCTQVWSHLLTSLQGDRWEQSRTFFPTSGAWLEWLGHSRSFGSGW